MADAGRVGYRTNGLSSALQLHHPSSRFGQTDGFALSGVQARRKPMDRAIADSHPNVTISHSPPTRPIPTFDTGPTWTRCPILTRQMVMQARVRLRALRHPWANNTSRNSP